MKSQNKKAAKTQNKKQVYNNVIEVMEKLHDAAVATLEKEENFLSAFEDLYYRWQDECKHEDPREYSDVLKLVVPAGFKFSELLSNKNKPENFAVVLEYDVLQIKVSYYIEKTDRGIETELI